MEADGKATIEEKIADARMARKRAAEDYELTEKFWKGREDFTNELKKKGPQKPNARSDGAPRKGPTKRGT